MAFVTKDQVLQIVRLDNEGSSEGYKKLSLKPTAIDWSAEGRIAIGGEKGKVEVYESIDLSLIGSGQGESELWDLRANTEALKWAPNGEFFANVGGEVINVWSKDAHLEKALRSEHDTEVRFELYRGEYYETVCDRFGLLAWYTDGDGFEVYGDTTAAVRRREEDQGWEISDAPSERETVAGAGISYDAQFCAMLRKGSVVEVTRRGDPVATLPYSRRGAVPPTFAPVGYILAVPGAAKQTLDIYDCSGLAQDLAGRARTQKPKTVPVDEEFDVFICYMHEDRDEAALLRDELVANGIRTWFDEDHARPGYPWIKEVSDGMKRTGAVVVCVGGTALSDSQVVELAHYAKFAKRGRHVIPVYLKSWDGSQRPRSLDHLAHVDLRVEAANPIEKLLSVLQRSDGS